MFLILANLSSIDKRSITLKLCRRDIERDLLHTCKELKPKFYVNESLTPKRSTITYAIRKVKQEFPDKFESARSVDGSVCAYIPVSEAASRQHHRRVVVNNRRRQDPIHAIN